MEIINGVPMKNFTAAKFSEDPEKYADPNLLIALQSYRDKLNAPFRLSPAPGALARFDGRETSMHRVIMFDDKIVKKSKAIDGFPKGSIFKAWAIAISCGLWNGIGVYFDTELNYKYQPMLHLDQRKKPLMWYRVGKYDYYYSSGPDFFKDLMHWFVIDRNLRRKK